jgi:hypothetical protein
MPARNGKSRRRSLSAFFKTSIVLSFEPSLTTRISNAGKRSAISDLSDASIVTASL